jgi:lysophospholipid acyltransferase
MLKSQLDALAHFVGFPVDQLTAALCLILSIPFAFVLHNVVLSRRFRFLSHFCSVAPTFYLVYLSFWVAREGQVDRAAQFGLDLLGINLPIFVTFGLLRWKPKLNPIWIFCGLLALVSYHHISRQIEHYNEYVVNVTGPLMVMVIKLSAFAFDVFDGKIEMKRVKFVHFYAWSMFFAGFFTGPVVHYRQYTAFMQDPLAFLGLTKKQRHAIRGRKRRVFFLLSTAALLICAALVFKARFPHTQLLQVSKSSAPLWYRLGYMHLSLLEWRFKYYVAWMLAEAGIVVVGLGYKVGDHIQW